MAENIANSGDGGSDPATPSKRAEKKQDTRPTPERMKQKETETMEIDSDVVMEIQDPPKLHLTNKEGKERHEMHLQLRRAPSVHQIRAGGYVEE